MNNRFAALAAVLLLAGGCAQNGPIKPPAEPDVSSPIAGTTSGGASWAGMQQASAGPMAGRTRAEVLEAAKHHKSSMDEDIGYFQPH